jgi:hypothetical protein
MADRVHVSNRVSGASGHGREATCPRVLPLTGGHAGHGHDAQGDSQRIVSKSLPGVNAALANAIRQVNAAFNRLPESRRPDPAEWGNLDAELDAACLSGDRDRAMAAIRAWREHWLHELERAAR